MFSVCRDMRSCLVYVFLIRYQCENVVGKRPFTMNDFGNAFALAKDDNSKIVRTKTHMQCIYKCVVRQNCNLFSSNLVPKTGFFKEYYSCGLTKDSELYAKLYNMSNTCATKADYMVKIPKAIGGPCSDHKCSAGQVCTPRVEGGYSCKRERGRKRGGKRRKQR